MKLSGIHQQKDSQRMRGVHQGGVEPEVVYQEEGIAYGTNRCPICRTGRLTSKVETVRVRNLITKVVSASTKTRYLQCRSCGKIFGVKNGND